VGDPWQGWRATPSEAGFLENVRRAREHILAGDIFQVVLSRRWRRMPRCTAAEIYRMLRLTNPSPYMFLFDTGQARILGASPEMLVRVRGRSVATCPIAGTRRRGASLAEDLLLEEELRADPKERAEHVMIVDLERNDLGRICAIGSVAVADLFAERAYPLLTHMESAVHGRLRPGTALADVLRAIFPGGSITGAPKIRAMQIIEELEPAARGFYTGAIGWSEPDGRTTLNISIRTAVLDADGLCYWAGGGIVADSDPEREYAETGLKTEALARALAAMEKDAR
jgi:anthranilate synthase component 1